MAMGASPVALERVAVVMRSASLITNLRLAVPADCAGLAIFFCELEGWVELADRAFVMVREGRQSGGGKCNANACCVSVVREFGAWVVLCNGRVSLDLV